MHKLLKKAKRLKRKTYSSIFSNYYSIKNLFTSKKVISSDDRLIISLTTHPPRIKDVFITIESLFSQDIDNFVVYLYIAKQDLEKIKSLPASIKRLKKRGLKVVAVENDYRSYNKLVHALAQHPESTIITADDDTIYPYYWARKLLEGHSQYPDCIICHRGHMLSETSPGSGQVSYDLIKNKHDEAATHPNLYLMPTGNSGVLYPPRALDPIIFDAKSFQELSPNADDIWFKMASLKKKTKCVRINFQNVEFLPTNAAAIDALHEENIKKGGNDRQFMQCFQRYPELYSMLFGKDKSTTIGN